MSVAKLNSGVRSYLVANKDYFPALVTRTGKDKYPDSDDRFDNAPYFNFDDDKVKFDAYWFDNANDNCGSVSGFVPKFFPYQQKVSARIPFVLSGYTA